MPGTIAVEHLVDLGPAHEEVDVVLPGEPDAAVQLQRLPTEVGEGVVDIGARRLPPPPPRRPARRPGPGRRTGRRPACASSSMCMSASRCLMAWKLPMVRPNCTRFFRYSTVRRTGRRRHRPTPPTGGRWPLTRQRSTTAQPSRQARLRCRPHRDALEADFGEAAARVEPESTRSERPAVGRGTSRLTTHRRPGRWPPRGAVWRAARHGRSGPPRRVANRHRTGWLRTSTADGLGGPVPAHAPGRGRFTAGHAGRCSFACTSLRNGRWHRPRVARHEGTGVQLAVPAPRPARPGRPVAAR